MLELRGVSKCFSSITAVDHVSFSARAGSFDQILTRVAASRQISAEPDSAEYLPKLCLREGRTELRACYPADICNILLSIGRYEGRGPIMTKPELERAASLYFAKS